MRPVATASGAMSAPCRAAAGQPERLEFARLIAHQGDQRRHHQGQGPDE